MNTRNLPKILIAIAIASLMSIGCTGSGGSNPAFASSFGSVSTGATKDQVRVALGQPDDRLHRRLTPARVASSPQELSKALPASTPYEEWVYRRGETDYHLYFASGSNAPVEEWHLIARRAVPHTQQ